MKRAFAVGLAAATLGWLGGFGYFYLNVVPHQRAPDGLRTDAVVAFTGLENMRIRQGLEVYRTGVAARMLVSGVDPGVTKARLLRWLYRQPPGDLWLDFTLGYQATNTVGNAEETAAWACANHLQSIRLVTADYHMPRALFLLRRAWPTAEIVPDPLIAPYGHRSNQSLYRLWGVWQSFVEYHKLAVQRFRYARGTLKVPPYQCPPATASISSE